MAQMCFVKLFAFSFSFVLATTNFCDCIVVNFDGKVAGNWSISECVNGYKPTLLSRLYPEMYITTTEFARKMGYPTEEHLVQTDDGYILTLHRIPGKPGAPPAFVQHGFVCSSYVWVASGKEKALAFLLADAGYDVWLGNTRGSTYSRCHNKYQTSDNEFWDFEWQEMGVHDLPTMIMYVTKTTGQKIIFVGQSMGTTIFFITAIEWPDVTSHVKAMMAMAPMAFLDHATTPHRILAHSRLIEILARAVGSAEMFSENPYAKVLIKYACTLTSLQAKICANVIFSSTIGFDSKQFNYTLAPDIFYHLPAGSSLKIISHYSQIVNSKRFQHYDYGPKQNLILYNSISPPNYNISKIAVPIGIFWADKDLWADPIDVMRFYEQVPNKIISHRVEYPDFDHEDFLFAIDARKYVYEKILAVMQNYE